MCDSIYMQNILFKNFLARFRAFDNPGISTPTGTEKMVYLAKYLSMRTYVQIPKTYVKTQGNDTCV